jgi:hypothetical protein
LYNELIFMHIKTLMKKFIPFVIVVLIFIVSGLLIASLTLQFFTAKPSGDGILIEWKTADEGGVNHFELERSANSPDNFIAFKTINSTGNNSYYSFLDNGVNLRVNNNAAIYFYRLKCVFPNGSYSYTNTISVSYSVSGIKSTWGSIKAIFR